MTMAAHRIYVILARIERRLSRINIYISLGEFAQLCSPSHVSEPPVFIYHLCNGSAYPCRLLPPLFKLVCLSGHGSTICLVDLFVQCIFYLFVLDLWAFVHRSLSDSAILCSWPQWPPSCRNPCQLRLERKRKTLLCRCRGSGVGLHSDRLG